MRPFWAILLLSIFVAGTSISESAWSFGRKGQLYYVEGRMWFGNSPDEMQGPSRCAEYGRCAKTRSEAKQLFIDKTVSDMKSSGWRNVRVEIVSIEATGQTCVY